MKKTTLRTLLTLLALLLVFTMIFTVAACTNKDDPTDTEEEKPSEETFTSLITNGDFSSTSGTTQPYTPSSWNSYTVSNVTDSEQAVAGVIDTGAAYDSAKTAWDSIPNPYGEAKENKLLMVYNKELNVYGYYESFSSTVGAYYTISAKIKTVNVEGAGVTFRISSNNGYHAFNIPAAEDFTEYTFYLIAPQTKTSSDTSNSIYVYLTLGYGTEKSKGYVFFDDIVVTKIKSSEYKTAQTEKASDTKVKFVSMLQPDGEFDYYSSSSSAPHTPSSWSTKTGESVADATISTSYIKRGIISTEAADWATLSESYPKYYPTEGNPGTSAFATGNDDKHVLGITAIAQSSGDEKYTPTAVAYTSKNPIHIEISTLYEVSVWVKAAVDKSEAPTSMTEEDFAKQGAAIVLNGADKYSMTAIQTNYDLNNGWEKITFYIFGNEYSAKDFTIELWLGMDESAATLTQGCAYFDKLTFKSLGTFSDRDAKLNELKNNPELSDDYKTRYEYVDLKSIKTNMVPNHDLSDLDPATSLPVGMTFDAVDNVVVNEGDVITKMIDAAALAADEATWTATWKDIYKLDANPLYPYAYSNVLLVNNVIPSAYKVTALKDSPIEVKQNLHYRLSVWVKTVGIDEDDKMTLALLDDADDSKHSFSVNTADYSDEMTNDYVEYIFYLQGANASAANAKENSNKVYLSFSLGSGTKYDPSSYKKGAFLIASINMEQITYTEYNKATSSDYSTKYSFASDSSSTVTNGTFNSYDLEKTEIDQESGHVKLLDEYDNKGYYVAAIPSSWENNVNEAYGTFKVSQNTKDGVKDVKVNKLIAGIINKNNIDETNAYLGQFGLDANLYNGWADSVVESTKMKSVDFSAPNLLMITTRNNPDSETITTITLKNTYKEDDADEDAEEKVNDKTSTPAIKSPSISLSANSYYVLKFYARATAGTVGQVYLTTSSTNTETSMVSLVASDNWVEYIFLVETGLSSVSANFEIYYGEKGNEDTPYSGTILLDSFTYYSIDKDLFDEYKDRDNTDTAIFTTTTFDTESTDSETAVKPNLFSGSGESTSGYTNSEAQVAGVITKNSYKYENLGIYKTEKVEGDDSTQDEIVGSLTADVIFSTAGITDATLGNYVLLINNRKANYYTYETTSLTLESDSCYKFSAYVRTAWLEKDANAKVKVTIGDDSYTLDINTGSYDENGTETIGEWKLVNFYINNEKASSVTDAKLAFILGENTEDGKIKGYLFIDNVSLAPTDKDTFAAATADDYTSVIALKDEETTEEEGGDDDNGEGKEEKKKISSTLFWTYVTSIAIAVILIAVIAAWLIRKYVPKKTKGAKGKAAASYDRNNASKPEEEKEETNSGTPRDEYKD
ncbi:MAG: hypothetical protein J6Y74_03335 [Clostridia bacterium]|nr:hypothetical protein [Clostridia bacterium]